MMFRGQEIKVDHFEPCIHRGSKRKIACCGQWICRLHNTDCRLRRYDDSPNLLACNECNDKELDSCFTDRTAGSHGVISKLAVPIVAVTSINPNPDRHARQLKCLQTWSDAGLSIVVVNTKDELNAMPWIGDIATPLASNAVAEGYDRPVQKVKALLGAGISSSQQFMVINSDIEISGNLTILSEAIKARGHLTIGVRYNYDKGKDIASARREPAGLDVFVMTPELAETVIDIGLGIGKPTWDYWLPLHFHNLGVKFNWIQSPLFFHESHPIGWSNTDWIYGNNIIKSKFGVSIAGPGFRKRLQSW